MNGTDILADTNAIIYFVNGNDCMKPYRNNCFNVSIISEMELLSFPAITESETNRIKAVINKCIEINIDTAIKEKTIELRKKYSTKLPDSIIAATAICRGLKLVTADKGFSKIEELNLQLIEPVM
ncbi:MAG: type II toxin-antitoxin system VapC family toxin [Catonella sp.]|jgi:predicted nucleic acid-binding protein|nr:type II toxin-antitoxin system VapC family toxin [Catonella sp.]